MNCDYYSVLTSGGLVLAKGMTLENALLFVKALFEKFYCEADLCFMVAREDNVTTSAAFPMQP